MPAPTQNAAMPTGSKARATGMGSVGVPLMRGHGKRAASVDNPPMRESASDLPSPTGPWPADLARLVAIALEAGRAILEIYHDPARIQAQTKGDGSPLTAADLAADAVIRAGLSTHFAGVPVVSEESLPGPADGARTEGFLVDPVDGTKEFLKRNGEFTVNIALIRDGLPVLGVVHVPPTRVTYLASDTHGSWKRDADACNAECQFLPIEACKNGDGCCPMGCTGANDNDCSTTCGNSTVDAQETCDGNCPAGCDDNNRCTSEKSYGSAATCSLSCGSLGARTTSNSS